MGRFIQLVMGPAGVGKSSYCKTMQDHCRASRRSLHVGNLDPACDNYEYEPSFDIKELIKLEDVIDELGYGPNGGLVYCMEYLLQNSDWLRDELECLGEDDCILLDCPGQVELYSHLPVMHDLGKLLTSWGFRVVAVYLLDALFVLEPYKFISGCMLSLSCMLQLELPHINVITKCDIAEKEKVEQILDTEGAEMLLARDANSTPSSGSTVANKLSVLSHSIASIIDDYMIVSFAMLDITDEDSIEDVLFRADHCVQYGEDAEPREPRDADMFGDGTEEEDS